MLKIQRAERKNNELFLQSILRIFQICLRAALPILPYINPRVLKEITDIPEIIIKEGLKKPLIISDKNLSKLDIAGKLRSCLNDKKIDFSFFDGAFPNPTTDLALEAYSFYKANNCDSLIALGGGSPIDLAKSVGVLAVKPNKPLAKMAGILKVRRRIPLLIAIPTTAGTGSETTLAAVIIDSKTKRKFAINDFPLIPKYAVLTPETIHSLPHNIAAETGIDALTHAVEAFIGRSTTKGTRRDALEAARLIYSSLDDACDHKSKKSEAAMLYASHLAGRAFTRSYVGYVHAVSHSLSGEYNLSHGRTNATLLPIVLIMYGNTLNKKLARLAVAAGIGQESDGVEALSEAFISSIEAMNARHGIPHCIPEIIAGDISKLAKCAAMEANPLYPVPVLWDASQLEKVYRKVMVSDGNK